MSLFAAVSIAEIKARGSIKDADVSRLRKNFADCSVITPAEAEQLRSLNEACPIQDPAWRLCFVELMTDFIVGQTEPEGYMNAHKCDLLRTWIAPDGAVATKLHLDLAVSVIAASRWVPQSFVVLVLDQVRRAVVRCEGPLRAGRLFEERTVTAEDVTLLRQVLQAFCCEGSEGVTQAEAAVLLDIDRIAAASANDPGWRALFLAAVGTAMLVAAGYRAPGREETLARAAWPEDPDLDDILVGRQGARGAIIQAFSPMSREEWAILRLTQQKVAIVTREDVPPYASEWLAEHLAQPAGHTPNMLALLRFLKGAGCRLDAGLQAAIDRVQAAA
ncbi:MAG: hypothetical protein NW223_24240 [Hyphomicrobiaceae bacterium]|nr:hypothetical protein [Hyphomicrobiaceae bacterium]